MAEQPREIRKIKLFTLFLAQPHKFSLIRTLLLYTRKQNDCKKSFSQKTTTKAVAVTNKHLRCSFFSGKGFFLFLFFSYGQYFLFETSESVLWTTSKKKKIYLSAFGLTSLFKQKDWYGGGLYTSMQKYREGRRVAPSSAPPRRPSFKTAFSFPRHKNTQTVAPPQCLPYTVPPHLWKRQAGLDG